MSTFTGKIDHSFVVKKTTQDRCKPTCIIPISNSQLVMGLKPAFDKYVYYDLPFKTFDLSDQNNLGLKDYYSKTTTGYAVTGMALSPSNEAIIGFTGNNIVTWDPLQQKSEQIFYSQGELLSGSLGVLCPKSHPGNQEIDWNLICCSCDKTIKIVNPRTQTVTNTLSGHDGYVICVHVISENRIVSGSSDSTIRIWDKLEPFETLTTSVKSVAKILLGFSKLSDQWSCTKILSGHTGTVRCIELLSPFEIVSASDDGTLRTWDLSTGECTGVLQLSDTGGGYTTKLITTPDHKILSLTDGILRLWDLNSGSLKPSILNLQNDQNEYMLIECMTMLWDHRIIGVCQSDDFTYKFLIWK